MGNAFQGAHNMMYKAADTPDLSGVTDMSRMFAGARSFNGDISAWDVSSVTDMSVMFQAAFVFNGNISGWDVSSVTDMTHMFRSAISFNQNISGWDVSSVTDMAEMFRDATSFNQNLGPWYVTLNSTTVDIVGLPGVVGKISSQNDYLDRQHPRYMIGDGPDSHLFEVYGRDLLTMTSAVPGRTTYVANITASGSSVFESGNNWRTVRVNLEGEAPPPDPDAFITTWRTASLNGRVTLPVSGSNITIHWGDGTSSTGVTDTTTHTYAVPGDRTVSVSGGLERFHLNNRQDRTKLVSLDQWGNSSWTTMSGAFLGASNMVYKATDTPDLSGVTDMRNMFWAASSFNGDLSGWDVSSVTDMSRMFEGARSFNGDLSGWDVSSVTNMIRMFEGANSFNGNISGWDVSTAINMFQMFQGATSFNQNLGPWYVTLNSTTIDAAGLPGVVGKISSQNDYLDRQHPRYMIGDGPDSHLFEVYGRDLLTMTSAVPGRTTYVANITASGSSVFESGNNWRTVRVSLEGEVTADPSWFITTWRTASPNEQITLPVNGTGITIFWGDGTNSTGITDTATHTYAYPGDYTVSVTGGLQQFHLNSHPDRTKLVSLDQWGNASWTTMNRAFWGAHNMVYEATDTPDLSGVTDMNRMFASAFYFNGDLSAWNVSSVTDMNGIFGNTNSFNGNLSAWDVSSVTDMTNMFSGASSFNQNISGWDTSSVTDMRLMFRGAVSFNGNISGWDTSSVTDMTNMFWDASSFNQNISTWNVGSVTDMSRMFLGASSFNQNISGWDTSSVTDMRLMFRGASSFNGNISAWNVSSVTDMNHMFRDASSFNGNISAWNVGSVTHMAEMFRDASSFNGNISTWNVSRVTDMNHMFAGASSFNGNISAWNVSRVTDMNHMFRGASSFNGNISAWNVSSVTDMNHMFRGASSFNGNISTWDVGSVTHMIRMFQGATSFNGNISAWNVSTAINMIEMFQDASSFEQNLGLWYVTLNSATIDAAGLPGAVGRISSQNNFLNNQNPTYMMGAGDDSHLFEVSGNNLLNMTSAVPGRTTYMANITASGGSVFEDGNNWRTVRVNLEGDVTAFFSTTLSTTSPSPTGASSIQVAVDFGEPVNATTFDIHDIYVTGGSASDLTAVSGNQTFTFTITPSDDGTVTTSIPTGSVKGPAGNTNTASNILSVIFDRTPVQNAPQDLQPPRTPGPLTVDAGTDRAVDEGDTVAITGIVSGGGNLTYQWTVHNRNAHHVVLADPSSLSTSFTAPRVPSDTGIILRLTVSDGDNTASDTVAITVRNVPTSNSPPTVDAGSSRIVDGGFTVTITGTATDPDGDSLAYLWSQVSPASPPVSFVDPAARTTSFTAPRVSSDTAFTLRLTVSDGEHIVSDTVAVTVRAASAPNGPPTIDAGADQTIREGDTVTLSGTVTDPDGDFLTHRWSAVFLIQPAAVLDDTSSLSTSFTAPQVDEDTVYTFRLTVSDGTATVTDTVSVRVLNVRAVSENGPPTVDAGRWQLVDEGITVTLTGTVNDPDGDSLTYLWEHIDRPGSTPAIHFTDPTSLHTTFVAPDNNGDASYAIRLTVSDGTDTVSDTVIITVEDTG